MRSIICKYANRNGKAISFDRLHSVDESMTELPELENPESERLRTFVHYLNGKKAFAAPVKVIR